MIRRVLLSVALLCLLPASVAYGSPTGAALTQDGVYVHVGQPVHFHGSFAVCDIPPCSESWKVFGSGYSRLGTPIGYGPDLTFTPTKVGVYSLRYQVNNAGRTNGFDFAQGAISVSL